MVAARKVATPVLRKRTRTETVKGTRKETRKRKGKGKVERRKECEGKRGKEKVQRDPAGMEWGFGLGNPATVGFIVTW